MPFHIRTLELSARPTLVRVLTVFLVSAITCVAQTGVLFQDGFTTFGDRLNLAAWTTEIGCSSFLGRTQLADWVTPGGVGKFVVGTNGAELALNTFNPTGFSLYGTHAKTIMSFQPASNTAIQFTTRMQLTSVQPGVVFGVYLYAIPTPCSAQTQHDEIDFEVVTNFLQNGSPLTLQLNRYANEPLGAGNGVIVNLPAGFDPLAVHDWTIRWTLGSIDYLVDGLTLYSTTTHVPQGPMQADVIAWGPDTTWPDAYSASLQPVNSAGQNQRFVADLRSVTVTAISTTPALGITKTHAGNFMQGQNGATYNLTVSNGAYAANTIGAVTVTENLPAGLALVSMAGTGWTCPAGTNSCTRSDLLAGGSSYPPIVVTVNVAPDAPSAVINQANVTGGGSATSNASDKTTILPVPTSFTVSGRITVAGAGLSGVTVDVNGSQTFSTITDASGNYSVPLLPNGSYTLSAAHSGYSFSAPVGFSNLAANQIANFTGTVVAGLNFFPVTPCRLVDTRVTGLPPSRPQPLAANTITTIPVPQPNACGIPPTAVAYVLNVTVVTTGYLGYLTIWPAGQPIPNVSTLNSYSSNSTAVANAAIVPAGTNGAINVFVTDPTDLIIDISGYFAPPSSGYVFYPVTPCRLVDTRVSTFPSGFGPPSMSAGQMRSFPVPAMAACGIPSTAQAYSLNVTAVPKGILGFLSIWPSGQSLPNVSTLNVYTPGAVVANAAIVPAGANGAISAYVTDSTDLVIDIDGYFAPPGNNGLRFYPATPCRVADTRVPSFPSGLGPPQMAAGMSRSFPVPESTCGVPPNAGAYSFNFTAVPRAPQLGIFITWPTGQPMPDVSTMNSYNGSVVSNAAIVPAGSNGAISIHTTDSTDVLFDINGYFAP